MEIKNMSERVTVDYKNQVATVTLNRPDKRNALDIKMFEGIVAAANTVGAADDVRAVVLTGAGSSFCAGLDLDSLMSNPNDIGTLVHRSPGDLTNLVQDVAWAWRRLRVPVIAAINGEAFGGGLQIALGADIRLLSNDARLSVMEIRWGLIPDMAGTRIMKDLLRLDVAKELTLTGRIVAAEEAVTLGLATRVCSDPLVDALAMAAEISSRSPDAVQAAKRLLDRAWKLDDREGFELETELQLALIGGRNQMEAARAGFEKRSPEFRPATIQLDDPD
jgi:enoyl-CoA hydratase/carnithine racemase